MNTNQKLWPSQTISTTRATKSTVKPMALKTDWAGGVMTFLFIALLVAGVLGGLYFLVLEDLFSQLQTLTDSLPSMQLASTGSK
jgi:predicted PurR-regulated permease PerM